MRSILTVVVPAAETDLTTLTRVRDELNVTSTTSDEVLSAKIEEASSDIEAALGYRVARETVSETFWLNEPGDLSEYILLDRTPVVSISSVTRDGAAMTSGDYRIDKQTGQLYRIDGSGYPCFWDFYQSLVVQYVGGYLLPDESGRDLPAGIEGACVDLVTSYWASRGRDGTVRQESIPGVRDVTYWVGAVGEEGELPPGVVSRLTPYRRAIM